MSVNGPPYQVVYADPAWGYRDQAAAGERGAAFKYPTMSVEEIAALPVADICHEDCCLFLWVTPPHLESGIQVVKSWGFEYRTRAFLWVKTCQGRPGRYHWGMGNWTRANPEDVLLGIRGKPKRVSKGVHSVIDCPVGEHSTKPAETRDRIVELMGDVPRIELFARETVPGWHSLGNAINGMDLADSLPLVASGEIDLNEQAPVGGPPEGDVLSQFLL